MPDTVKLEIYKLIQSWNGQRSWPMHLVHSMKKVIIEFHRHVRPRNTFFKKKKNSTDEAKNQT